MVEDIGVSVVYAEPDRMFQMVVRLPREATVGEAIEACGIREVRSDIEIDAARIGVFSRKATLDTPLHDGDRVEIYRALRIDPKEARRRRAVRRPVRGA